MSKQKGDESAFGVAAGSGITLHLVLTHHWFDETEAGRKRVEYRVMSPRWMDQIWERRNRIDAVRFARGYTSRTITRPVERIDIGSCPIPGWGGDFIRIHFIPNTPSLPRRAADSND